MLIGAELEEVYSRAKEFVDDCGYGGERIWSAYIRLEDLTESKFLSESAWVVLNSGMKESVIRGKWESISKAFMDWDSASIISANALRCQVEALKCFGHKGKIKAIADIAGVVSRDGFESVIDSISNRGVDYLIKFPYIGKITVFHLAKNIGLDVVKPDRHLVRIAEAAGYESPDKLCQAIHDITKEKVSVIDIVLWRYATLRKDYVDVFAC